MAPKRTVHSPLPQKRKLDSPMNLRKLMPIPDIKKKKTNRKPVGIQKAGSILLTTGAGHEVIREMHVVKQAKKARKKQIEVKVTELKKEMAAEQRKMTRMKTAATTKPRVVKAKRTSGARGTSARQRQRLPRKSTIDRPCL